MPRQPFLKFYTEDWLQNLSLRTCSLEARGLWIDMISWMHQGEPYGHLRVNGKIVDPQMLAKLEGVPEKELMHLLVELHEAGVLSYDDEEGIYSSRMVSDEETRKKLSAAGLKGGGNPQIKKRKERV